jgi:hypothetical protein
MISNASCIEITSPLNVAITKASLNPDSAIVLFSA